MKVFKFSTSSWSRDGWKNYFSFAETAEEVMESDLYKEVQEMVKNNKWNITVPKEITSDDIKIMFHFENSVPKEILNKYSFGYTMTEIPEELRVEEEKTFENNDRLKFKIDLAKFKELRGEIAAQEIDERDSFKYRQIVLYHRYPVKYLLPKTYWLQTKYIMFYDVKDELKQEDELDSKATIIFEKSILPSEIDVYVAIKVGKEMRLDIETGRAFLNE